jgi:succinyl-CoA synthetase beta subunit
LIESDGKSLFRRAGIATPTSVLVHAGEDLAAAGLFESGRCLVKAQVPVGGRGKAGGVIECADRSAATQAVNKLLGARLKGHTVHACLLERFVEGDEHYLAVLADPAGGGVRVLYSTAGGIQVEASNQGGASFDRTVDAELSAVQNVLAELKATLPTASASAIVDCAEKLASLFFKHELMVAEINPLFVSGSSAVAGDAKVVIDLNAIERQPVLMELLSVGREWYPDAWHKVTEDYDFIEIDADGDVALVTTGAGLSMMLLDELIAAGARPFNFADVRTGQMRGDPARLLQMMTRFREAGNIKVTLINVFAGITDLGEFAGIIVKALEKMPDWNIPIVARLIGNNEAAARAFLAEHAPQVQVVADLNEAIQLARSIAAAGHAAPAGGQHA